MKRFFVIGFMTYGFVGFSLNLASAGVDAKCQDVKIAVSGKVFNKPDAVQSTTDVIIKDQKNKIIFQKNRLPVSAASIDDENEYATVTNRVPPGHYKVISVLRRPDRAEPLLALEEDVTVCEGDTSIEINLAYPIEG